MADAPEWPTYRIGRKDNLFALGVASSQFAELEIILYLIFGNVFGIKYNDAMTIAAKIGCEATIDLTRRKLQKNLWPKGAQESVIYFLDSFAICMENRNHLMHSQFSWNEDLLYKTTKKGEIHVAIPTLAELRQIADDMNALFKFGRAVSNILKADEFETNAAVPWPDRPPPPQRLHYS